MCLTFYGDTSIVKVDRYDSCVSAIEMYEMHGVMIKESAMIYQSIAIDYKQFHYPKAVERALEFLKSHDFTTFIGGRYPIEGDLMYTNVDIVNTRVYEETKIEGHKDYMDVQFLVMGEEQMEVLIRQTHPEVVESYDDKDCYFYDPTQGGTVTITVRPGDYCIFYPGELHRTLIAPHEVQQIRKVVVKIHKSLLRE